jgi:hypothetical protein
MIDELGDGCAEANWPAPRDVTTATIIRAATLILGSFMTPE